MKNSILKFIINSNTSILIEPDEYQIDDLYCFWEANFSIIQNDHKTFICHYFFASYLEEFIIALKQALKNKRQIDSYFLKNIGFYWNISVNGSDQENPFNENYDILQKYILWQGHNSIWIYNDNQSNIILEITPSYTHTHNPKYSYQNFLQWISNYKSLGKHIISQETAQEWLTQATLILADIDTQSDAIYNK